MTALSPEKAVLAATIADRLANGLYHPGDPETEQEPMMMRLPMFRTIAAAPEMRKQVDLTVTLIAESIVYLIEKEGDFDLVPRGGESSEAEPEVYQPFGSPDGLRQLVDDNPPDASPTEEET